jgi:hypothetical protein
MATGRAQLAAAQRRWLTTFGVVATLLALLLALQVIAGPAPEAGGDAPAAGADAADGQPAAAPGGAALPADAASAAAQQQAAQAAVRREIGRPELQGRLGGRPAFVAEMEWQALQAVAQKSRDYDRELLRLVNNLRFHKQLELWHDPALEAATRQALGEQLLATLPGRVQQRDYSVAQARQLQQTLLAALEPDPARRRARLEAEARRIGAPLLEGEGGTVVP